MDIVSSEAPSEGTIGSSARYNDGLVIVYNDPLLMRLIYLRTSGQIDAGRSVPVDLCIPLERAATGVGSMSRTQWLSAWNRTLRWIAVAHSIATGRSDVGDLPALPPMGFSQGSNADQLRFADWCEAIPRVELSLLDQDEVKSALQRAVDRGVEVIHVLPFVQDWAHRPSKSLGLLSMGSWQSADRLEQAIGRL